MIRCLILVGLVCSFWKATAGRTTEGDALNATPLFVAQAEHSIRMGVPSGVLAAPGLEAQLVGAVHQGISFEVGEANSCANSCAPQATTCADSLCTHTQCDVTCGSTACAQTRCGTTCGATDCGGTCDATNCGNTNCGGTCSETNCGQTSCGVTCPATNCAVTGGVANP